MSKKYCSVVPSAMERALTDGSRAFLRVAAIAAVIGMSMMAGCVVCCDGLAKFEVMGR